LPLLGERELGLSTVAIGLAQSMLAIVDLLAMRYSGVLADRVGRRMVLVGGLASGVIAFVAGTAVSGSGFGISAASLGLVVGVTWVVPVAVVVDVASIAEDGLTSYRIAADAGQLCGFTGTGAIIGTIGASGGLAVFAIAFAALAGWVLQLPEVGRGR
jgi:DHA1 family multidrug resistance protein-like MFS transporter